MSTKEALTNIEVAHCLATIKGAAPHLRRTPDPDFMMVLDAMRENLFHAFDRLQGLERAEYAVGAWRYCLERGLYWQGLDMLIYSQAATGHYPYPLRVEACVAIGVLCQRLSQFDTSAAYFDIAWKIAHLLATPCDKAFILHQMGMMERVKGDIKAATKHHHDSMEIAKEQDDIWILAAGYLALGAIALQELRLEDADELFVKSGDLFASIGEQRRGIDILVNRAIVAGELGKFELAEKNYRKCLFNCRILNDPLLYAQCLHNLGDICSYTGKLEEAKSTLLCAYEEAKTVGYKSLLPNTIESLGRVCFLEGNHRRAVQFFSQAEHLRLQEKVIATRMEQNEPEKIIQTIRKTMKSNLFREAWKQGKQFAPGEVSQLLKL